MKTYNIFDETTTITPKMFNNIKSEKHTKAGEGFIISKEGLAISKDFLKNPFYKFYKKLK